MIQTAPIRDKNGFTNPLARECGRCVTTRLSYSVAVPGKVTLYVRDEQLWSRARAAGGPGGLSELVDQSLREWLGHHPRDAAEPSLLERSRRLLREAQALVAALEHPNGSAARRRTPGKRTSRI